MRVLQRADGKRLTDFVRILGPLLLTVVSIVLYGAGFQAPNRWPIAWVTLLPFLFAIRSGSTTRAVVCGWLMAVGCAYSVADGLPAAISHYYDQPVWLGIAFFVIMASLTTTHQMVGFALFYRMLRRRPTALLPVLTGASWVVGELVRARLTGNPWAMFGYTQAFVGPLVQIADVTGVYGPSFVLVAFNVALAEICSSLSRSARSVRSAVPGMLVASVVVAVVIAYGLIRPRSLTGAPGAESTKVSIVQGNIDVGSQWRRDLYGMHLEVNLRLTWEAIRDNQSPLVIWPENAMTFFLADEPGYQQSLARVLSAANTQLVAGGPHVTRTDNEEFHNSVFLVGSDGGIRARYDKQQLLPFAEYFPIRQLDFLRRSFGRFREFTPGRPAPPLPTVAGLAGVVICNEVLFPEVVAERVRDGAEILFALTNDGWLNDRTMTAVTFNMAAFRAVEQRRYLVRASTSGQSAIIDPRGRVTAQAGYATREVISGTIERRFARTTYSHLGDLFAIVCGLSALVAWLLRIVSR